MKIENRKAVTILSISLVTVFVLIQLFKTISFSGAWCSPYLGAPVELGHPAYQFVDYGFPLPFVTAVKADCFSAQSTTFEWSPIGLGVDGLLLALLAYPLWSGFLRKKPTMESKPDIIKHIQ
jgi:hypothetical protein